MSCFSLFSGLGVTVEGFRSGKSELKAVKALTAFFSSLCPRPASGT